MQLYSSATPNLFAGTVNMPSRGGAVNAMYYKGTMPFALFFFNGMGETTGPVSQGLKNGPLGWINPSFQPKYSIFWIQGFGWGSDADRNAVYAQMKTLLGFTKVALIGLSEGAMLATEILTLGAKNPIAADTVAFVCMSSQADDPVNKPAVAPIVALGIPVMGTGDAGPDSTVDGHAQFTQKFTGYLQAANPKGTYPFVNTLGTGHGGWTADTNPNAAFINGMSIETWIMQYASGGGTVVIPPSPTPITIKGTVISYSDGTSYTPTKAIKSVVINYTDGTSETKP